jgi:hypothetical protein
LKYGLEVDEVSPAPWTAVRSVLGFLEASASLPGSLSSSLFALEVHQVSASPGLAFPAFTARSGKEEGLVWCAWAASTFVK